MPNVTTLRWKPRFDATEYRVYRSNSPITKTALPTPLATLGGDATTYVDDTLLDFTTYFYALAVDNNDSPAVTTIVLADPITTDGDPLGPPPPFDPLQNPNTIGWFEMIDPADQTLSGADLLAVENRVVGNSVIMSKLDAFGNPTVGATWPLGGAAIDFNAGWIDFGGIPTTGTLNFFIAANRTRTFANQGLIGDRSSGTTGFPYGQSGSVSTSVYEMGNVFRVPPFFQGYYTDGNLTHEATTRGQAYTAFSDHYCHAILGVPAATMNQFTTQFQLGRLNNTVRFDGVMRRMVIVEGAMTDADITQMQTWFSEQDGWTI